MSVKKLDKKQLFLLMLFMGLVITISQILPDTAFAASNDYGYGKVLDGFGNNNQDLANLSDTLKNFGSGFTDVTKVIITIMTATAAIMVGFGVQEGRQAFWSWILAIGLAMNFAPILMTVFGDSQGLSFVTPPDRTKLEIPITHDASSFNFIGNFVSYYWTDIIHPGAGAIVPYACRICLVLTAIDASLQLGLKLVEGDKVKFLVSKLLNCGIYIFLIMNWVGYGPTGAEGMNLMGNLSNGLRALGYVAGNGADKYGADSIVSTCIVVVTKFMDVVKDAGLNQTFLAVFLLICTVFIGLMMLMIAMEMVMAQLEFMTMALVTIPLLAFGTLPQLNFLSNKAIGAMFNCGIKLMCITFLTAVIADTLTNYAMKMVSSADSIGYFEQFGNIVTFIFMMIIFWMLIKKMPALIQGLLSGNPSLSGGDMMGAMTNAANGAGNALGRVSAAMGGGSGGGGGGGGGSSGGGGGGGGGDSGPGGTMQQLKAHAGDIAKAVATGGAGAVAMAGGKMLAGAVKNKAANAKKAASEAIHNPGKTAAKATWGGLKAGGKLVGGTAKAGWRYGQRNLPGFKGYYDGKNNYERESREMNKKSSGSGSGGGSGSNLADQRAMMGSMMEAIGGEDMRKKFEDNFDKATGFDPTMPPPNPIVQAALDHNKKHEDE